MTARGAHPCDNGAAVPTAGAALATASDTGAVSWVGQWFASQSDFLVATIGGETPDYSVDQTFWSFYVNGTAAQTGVCHTALSPGDDVLLAVAKGTESVLKLAGPATAERGQPVAADRHRRLHRRPGPRAPRWEGAHHRRDGARQRDLRPASATSH